MHGNPLLAEARIDRFVADQIVPAVYRDRVPLDLTAWSAPGEPVPFRDAVGQAFEPVAPGSGLGRAVEHHLVPRDRRGARRLAGRRHRGRAGDRPGLLPDEPGVPGRGAGLAAGRHDDQGRLADATRRCRGPGTSRIDVFVEAAGNPNIASNFGFVPTPYGDLATAGSEPQYVLQCVDVALRDVAVWELLQDLVGADRADEGAAGGLHPAGEHPVRARRGMLTWSTPTTSRGPPPPPAAALRPLLDAPASASAHHAIAVGHAHIDSAWLWPVRETVRKCARTFSNVLALMDADPDFVFACSSAQQYAWMKEFYPELFDRIREKVAAGQFVPVGGMWVESDTNMPGGEAMARQMVAGKRFFLEEFGVETQDVWLPDSFGYSGALPQIVRAAGSKLVPVAEAVLERHRPDAAPHVHVGGHRRLPRAHALPAGRHLQLRPVRPRSCCTPSANFDEKGVAASSIVPFGWGDGGGGPTREMIASARRFAIARGCAARRAGQPEHVLRAGGGRVHAPAGVDRGDVPGVPPRHVHVAGAHQAGQPAHRAPAARGRAVGGDGRCADRGRVSVRRARDRSGTPCCCTSSTTSCRAARSAGCTARPRRRTRAIGGELEALIAASAARRRRRRVTPPLLLNAAPHARDGVAALGAGSGPGAGRRPRRPGPRATTARSACATG